MKKMLLVGCFFLAGVILASAEQGVGVGLSYRDDLTGPALGYHWMFSRYFGVEARASYLTGQQDYEVISKEEHSQGGRVVRWSTISTEGDMDVDAIPLELAVRIAWPFERWSPYLLLGGGYYLFDADIPSFTGQKVEPEDVAGFFAGLGAEWRISDRVALMAEINYTQATWEAKTDYSGSRREYRGFLSHMDYDYTGTQKVEGGLDGVGGNLGVVWMF